MPFTIQSVSKAFVFALALEMVGEERVAAAIGVEPSGEAFNSIRLTNDNRPFNPMVNAGAIACSGLIHQVDGADAFERIREKLGQFAGRELGVDEAVYVSEARPATATAPSPGCCGIIAVIRTTSTPCWTSISASARSWSPRAISR